VLDKYEFKAQSIDLSKEMAEYFGNIVKKQLASVASRDDIEMCEYAVVDEDLPNRVYTYALNNALSFSRVITEQLNAPTCVKPVVSLSNIKNNLWAYCIKTEINGDSLYSFRKISKSKVSTDEAQKFKERLSAYFDSSDAALRPVAHETISFDDKIDCIYISGQFYVFKKGGFEQIVGLEEELKQDAESVIDIINQTDLVEGLSEFKDEVMESRALLKKISSIAKKRNHKSLNRDEVDKMKQVLKNMEGRELKVNGENKIKLETKKDLHDFIKLLNDYYKQGMVTGSYYGTNSGRIIVPSA
jgi:hypothetical protein